MLMLCLVLAAAGPWMPGAGDVSPMDPTIAYGAAPNMLVFAPDGGAGFDYDLTVVSAKSGSLSAHVPGRQIGPRA